MTRKQYVLRRCPVCKGLSRHLAKHMKNLHPKTIFFATRTGSYVVSGSKTLRVEIVEDTIESKQLEMVIAK